MRRLDVEHRKVPARGGREPAERDMHCLGCDDDRALERVFSMDTHFFSIERAK